MAPMIDQPESGTNGTPLKGCVPDVPLFPSAKAGHGGTNVPNVPDVPISPGALINIEQRLASIEKSLAMICAAMRCLPEADAPSLAADVDADLIPLKVAAGIAGRTPDCVRLWCVHHNLGIRVGGRWYVGESRLREFLHSCSRSQGQSAIERNANG